MPLPQTCTPDGIDPVLLEVIDHALVAAAEEMSITIIRTSRSTTAREKLDYSTAIFDRSGRIIAQAARIPVHLNSMEPCLAHIVSHHLPLDQWRDGDVVVTNDPYCGGQHLPDFLAFKPVFLDGELLAITAILTHHVDVGGGGAGGYNPKATDIYGEGVRVPPVRIVRQGVWQQDLLAMILQNVRQPDIFEGDFRSQLGALEVGARSVRALGGKYGANRLQAAGDALIAASELAMRRAIRAMPDGSYDAEDGIDGDGIDPDRCDIRIRVRLTISGETLTVDFAGSSAQARGPINSTLASTQSAVYYAVIAAAGIPASTNSGCYRPITILAPEASVVDARAPAPVGNRMVSGHRVVTAVLRAFAQALPQRIPASYYAVTFNHAIDIMLADGSRRIYYDSEIGGWGGHPDTDGASAFSAGFHNVQNQPIEITESLFPLTFLRYALLPDSGGAGKHRGGLGVIREWRFEAPAGFLHTSFDAFLSQPYGLQGGAPGSAGRLSHVRDGNVTALASKNLGFPLRQGDVIRMETPGGGGHGDPALRDPDALAVDLRDGYVRDRGAYAAEAA